MFTAAVVTVSDKGYRGEREDTAGPLVQRLLAAAGYAVSGVTLVPDDMDLICDELIRLSDIARTALIVTTGGTGFSPRDVTPEATMRVCARLAPGIPEAMRAACLPITNRAMLSRAVAGIRGESLIVNLPGSPKAVSENLTPVLPALMHGLEMLRGTKSECAVSAQPRPFIYTPL